MITAVDHVVVYVSDQKAALEFYTDRLGFELKSCSTGSPLYWGYWVKVAPVGSKTSLLLALRGSKAETQGNSIMLACSDMRRTYDKLVANGVEFTMYPIGGLEWVSFIDPDGNSFHMSDNLGDRVDEDALHRLMQSIPDGHPV